MATTDCVQPLAKNGILAEPEGQPDLNYWPRGPSKD